MESGPHKTKNYSCSVSIIFTKLPNSQVRKYTVSYVSGLVQLNKTKDHLKEHLKKKEKKNPTEHDFWQ